MREIGAISTRPFDPSRAGGRILRLDYQKARITHKGIYRVEAHIRRFSPVGEAELKMVERLRKIIAGQLAAEPVDLRFYTHELRECLRYKKIGYSSG